VAWTSLAWLAVLGVTVAGFLSVLERQDRKLELLLERMAPAAASSGFGTQTGEAAVQPGKRLTLQQ
jgi:hypothetical protein